MRNWSLRVAAAIGLTAAIGVSGSQAASERSARIVGRVLVCNTPTTCLTRQFTVSAINLAGHAVARAASRGVENNYALRVRPGAYKLEAVSSGLHCQASARAAAHHTTHKSITCLVP
jgi:hypothetical protein